MIQLHPLVESDSSIVDKFCANSWKVLRMLMEFNVCIGANHDSTKDVWISISGTQVDRNPYHKDHYTEQSSYQLQGLYMTTPELLYLSKAFQMEF